MMLEQQTVSRLNTFSGRTTTVLVESLLSTTNCFDLMDIYLFERNFHIAVWLCFNVHKIVFVIKSIAIQIIDFMFSSQ